MNAKLIESAEDIEISNVGEGYCRVRTQDRDLVLSFNATYDLVLKLAHFIHAQDEMESEWPLQSH